ncbi:hypothetical protein BDN71DRAFT_1435850 [Pleurotus eryngii]|uniref:Uncharacterized protein n=1 Tax=Pleurotus eryngii TaxID=5323 RepID=A0A9P6DAN9_PLEER|nr:hypothetical protein BDN71DRAFT_1435850 [Pleurotus eryngii]
MTQASAKKVAKPVTSKPRKTAPVALNDSNNESIPAATSKPQKKAMIAIGKAVQPVVPKPQQKAPVKVVHSNDSNDEPIQPVASDIETAQPATVAIKEGQPDQPSDDEDEQAQIIHSSRKRHIAHIQSSCSSAEHGMEPESPTPVGSGTRHPALKLRKSLVAEESDSGRAAESSKPTDTTSSTGKAALPVAEAAVTIAEPESTTPVGPWTGPTLKLRKPLVAGESEVPKRSVELSKATDATSLASEATPSDAEAAVPKRYKKKHAALPDTEAAVPKCHKTKHVASTSEVAAQAVPKHSKTKNAATLSTGKATIPVEPTITNVGSASESHLRLKHKVMHKAKCSKMKHATGSTTEAAPPLPVLKHTKTKHPLRAKHTETGNDKGQQSTLWPDAPKAAFPVQQGPHQRRQPPSLDGSNTAHWDSYSGPFNAVLDPGMDSSNSSQYPPNWPYPLPPGYGRPHLPAFDSLDTQHGPPSYFPELHNPYVCPPHPNYPQGRLAHDVYGLQDGSSGMYLHPPFEYPHGRSPHDTYGGPSEGSSGTYICLPHSGYGGP